MTDDTNNDTDGHGLELSADHLSDPLHFDPPDEWPEWWLPPTGHGVSRVVMSYDTDRDRRSEYVNARGQVNWPVGNPDLGTKLHSRADPRPLREFAALLDAYSGYVPVPDDHPSDENPLDALYALRALRQCAANLTTHPFVESDETTVGALEAVERDLRAAEAKYERACDRAGLPTGGGGES